MIPYVPPPSDDESQRVTSNPPPPRPKVEEGIQEGYDSAAQESDGDPRGLVTVSTFRFVHEAELAKLHLANEGIQSFIMDAETVTMDWLLGNAIGNIKLQVAGQDAERAEVLLEPFHPDPNAAPIPESGDFACLSCGATIPPDESKCPACGWSYTDEGIQPTDR